MSKLKVIVDGDDKPPETKAAGISDFFSKYKGASTIEVPDDAPSKETSSDLIHTDTSTPGFEFNPSGNEPKKRASRRTKKTAFIGGEVLTGALFISLVDMLLPMAIATLSNKFSKDQIKA